MTNIIYIYKTINKKKLYKRRIKESQECYIIIKKIIRHWNVPTLSFSFLLHFLHFFLTFSFSFFLYSQIFSSPPFGSLFSLLNNSPFFLLSSSLHNLVLPLLPFFFFSPQFGSPPSSFSNLLLLFILSFGSPFFIFLFFYDPLKIKSNINLK